MPTSSALDELVQTQAPAVDPAGMLFQMATGYVVSSALWVAAELKVADLIGPDGTSMTELVHLTGANEDALYRALRLLATTGIFTEMEPRRFALTPTAELLRMDHPRSMRDAVIWLADPFHLQIASHLVHSIRTGQPTVEHVTGKPVFEYLMTDKVEFDRFHLAMTNLSGAAIAAALEAYDFTGCETIVDIGGGHGFAICAILKKYPNMRGILFDLQEIVAQAEKRIRELELQNRCSTAYGDFFKAVPESGDIYFMKHVIHDWNNEQAAMILRNIRRAMKGRGKLLLLEFVLPGANVPHPSKVLDIEMLLFPGGRERSEDEWSQLFKSGGFNISRIIPTQSPFCIIEAEPL